MGLKNAIALVLDTYERKARLYPALLSFLPIGVSMTVQPAFSPSTEKHLLSLVAACGVIYLLANIARMLGKAEENRLYRTWGAAPTTQLLRHSDENIDPHTKKRYHAFLGRKLKLQLPSVDEESMDPNKADEVYRAATKWLIEKCNDKKRFPMLLSENISYGFHRNSYGLRWIALVFCITGISWLLLMPDLRLSVQHLSTAKIATLAVELAIVVIWLSYFTSHRVRQAGIAYGERLFRGCDSINRDRGDQSA